MVTSEVEQDYSTYFLSIRSIEIVGHEITILDVLNWLEDYDYYINTNGDLYEHDSTYVGNSTGFLYLCSFNLGELSLKDQPEEAIKFLYDIIKQ